MKINISIMDSGILPTKTKNTNFSYNVCVPENVLIKPHESKVVSLKLKIIVPDDYYFELIPIKPFNKQLLIKSETPGITNCGFAGEIKLNIKNICADYVLITPTEPVCQIDIKHHYSFEFNEVDNVINSSK